MKRMKEGKWDLFRSKLIFCLTTSMFGVFFSLPRIGIWANDLFVLSVNCVDKLFIVLLFFPV